VVQFDNDGFDNFGNAFRALNEALFWEDMYVSHSHIDGFWYVVAPNEQSVYQIESYAYDKWQALQETGTASFPGVGTLQEFLDDGHFKFLNDDAVPA